jgi:hypothetical protein
MSKASFASVYRERKEIAAQAAYNKRAIDADKAHAVAYRDALQAAFTAAHNVGIGSGPGTLADKANEASDVAHEAAATYAKDKADKADKVASYEAARATAQASYEAAKVAREAAAYAADTYKADQAAEAAAYGAAYKN